MLWLVSIAGALLFLGAGFFAGRLRPPPAEAAPDEPTTPALGELQDLRFQLEAVTRERDEARSARRGLAAEVASLKQAREPEPREDPALAEAREQISRLDQERATLLRDRDGLRRQADELRRKVEQARSGQADLERKLAQASQSGQTMTRREEEARERLTRQCDALKAELTRLKAEAEQAKAGRLAAEQEVRRANRDLEDLRERNAQSEGQVLELERLRQQAREVDTLREERSRVNAALQEARQEIASLRGEAAAALSLTTENSELKIRLQLLSEQLGELEQLREENARLRSSTAAATELEAELDRLRAENARLRARSLVQEPPRAASSAARTRPDGLGGSLQSLLDRVSGDPSARGAIVSDRAGLLVAGGCEQADALAAAAAMLSDVGRRLRQILTLGTVQILTCLDENGLVFTTLPFSVPPDDLLLATLTVGAPPERQALERMIAEL
jgi:chromosome segregation ATPase